MNKRSELIVGLIISIIVLAIGASWLWMASQGSVPFVLAFGLPNNLIVNLVILVILALILGVAFRSLRRTS